jgi:hypothetical protein
VGARVALRTITPTEISENVAKLSRRAAFALPAFRPVLPHPLANGFALRRSHPTASPHWARRSGALSLATCCTVAARRATSASSCRTQIREGSVDSFEFRVQFAGARFGATTSIAV